MFSLKVPNPDLINNKLFPIAGTTQMVQSPGIVYLEFLFFSLVILAVHQHLKDTQLLYFSALPFSLLTSSPTGMMIGETITTSENKTVSASSSLLGKSQLAQLSPSRLLFISHLPKSGGLPGIA